MNEWIGYVFKMCYILYLINKYYHWKTNLFREWQDFRNEIWPPHLLVDWRNRDKCGKKFLTGT